MKCLSVIIGHTTVHSWDTFVDNIVCLLLDDMALITNLLVGLFMLLPYSMFYC